MNPKRSWLATILLVSVTVIFAFFSTPSLISLAAPAINEMSGPFGVSITPQTQGDMLINSRASFTVNIKNTGTGEDRYTLETAHPSNWIVSLYKPNGQTYVDTNNDGKIDTDLVQPTSSVKVIVVVQAPANIVPGQHATITITATSTNNNSAYANATMQCTVPLDFAQIYKDNYGIHLRQIWSKGIKEHLILDFYREVYTGASFAVEAVSKGNYIVTWEKLTTIDSEGRIMSDVIPLGNGEFLFQGKRLEASLSQRVYNDIFYTLVNPILGPGTRHLLTNSAELIGGDIVEAIAQRPAVALDSNGNIAIAWALNQRKSSGDIQSNIMLALLDSQGNSLIEPYSVTKNNTWYAPTENHIYENQSVAVIGNTYTVCWSQRFDGAIYCQRLSRSGTSFNPGSIIQVASEGTTTPPEALFTTPLLTNDLLLVYSTVSSVKYATLTATNAGTLTSNTGSQPRAVQFTNGKVLIAWIDNYRRVAFTTDYGSNIYYIDNPHGEFIGGLSMTLVPSGQAVLTWRDDDALKYLAYAAISKQGNILTPATIFISDPQDLLSYETNDYGFGNAEYYGVYQLFLPLLRR